MKPINYQKQNKYALNSLVAIEAIADLLANFHDWPSENLEIAFRDCILDSFSDLSPNFIQEVYESFIKIDPKLRFDPNFNHIEFVTMHAQKFRNIF